MRIPLAIGGVLVVVIFGGWIARAVYWVIYALMAAPLVGFGLAHWTARMLPPEDLRAEEVRAFFSTAAVTAVCLALWALALDDLR